MYVDFLISLERFTHTKIIPIHLQVFVLIREGEKLYTSGIERGHFFIAASEASRPHGARGVECFDASQMPTPRGRGGLAGDDARGKKNTNVPWLCLFFEI